MGEGWESKGLWVMKNEIFFSICPTEIRALKCHFKTSGYRIIVDGQHLVYKKLCKSLVQELNTILHIYHPHIFRNYNQELTFDFDTTNK